MNEPVARVIEERERLESGLRGGVVFSVAGHILLAGAAIAAPFILPAPPRSRSRTDSRSPSLAAEEEPPRPRRRPRPRWCPRLRRSLPKRPRY